MAEDELKTKMQKFVDKINEIKFLESFVIESKYDGSKIVFERRADGALTICRTDSLLFTKTTVTSMEVIMVGEQPLIFLYDDEALSGIIDNHSFANIKNAYILSRKGDVDNE